MDRFSLFCGLIIALAFFVTVTRLEPTQPDVIRFARTLRLAEIDTRLKLIDVKAALTGRRDYGAQGHLYLARGWIADPSEWDRAREAFYLGALRGGADSAYHFGVMNLTGIGGPKNIDTALLFFETAARAGHRNAHWQLGNLYLSPALYDVGEASRWFAHAFRLGDERALALLVSINPSLTRNA